MHSLSLATVLKAALLAGLVAGLTVALFHAVVTEPVIDRAIALEEERHAGEAEHEPIVSRQAQKGGLFLGFLIYGLTWASLFGIVYHAVQRWLPISGGRGQRLLVSIAAYWAVGLLPFLKYPAKRRRVGDPETIGYRQALYLAFLALSVVGTVLAVALTRRFARDGGSGLSRWGTGLAALGAISLFMFLVMPGNPDPIEMPADVMASFRALSLLGLTLFWAVLGLLFTVLLKPSAPPASIAH